MYVPEHLLSYLKSTIMQQLVSIDLKANFGFFRKPDLNDGISLSYNMLHKPALLGILGAILGLEGYTSTGKLPEYYEKLQDIPIGIQPLNHEQGNFQKTVIKYSNTVGYANKKSNFLTEEATLIDPTYRCFILLDMENSLHQQLCEYLKKGYAEYLPYLGKNECSAWWDIAKNGFKSYDFTEKGPESDSFKITSIFNKGNTTIQDKKDEQDDFGFDFMADLSEEAPYMFFERLPVGFDLNLNQYQLADFVLTSFSLKTPVKIPNLFYLKNEDTYVQLF